MSQVMPGTRTMKIVKETVLWIVTLLLVLVCFRSGLQKVTGNVFWVRDFHRWGYPDVFRSVVGIAEIASGLLLVVPRFAAYGASVFAIVMLGAIYTHATHGESSRLPFNFLLLAFSIIIMIGRHPSLLTRLRQYKKS
jgi:putative oxidoreductase